MLVYVCLNVYDAFCFVGHVLWISLDRMCEINLFNAGHAKAVSETKFHCRIRYRIICCCLQQCWDCLFLQGQPDVNRVFGSDDQSPLALML